MLQDYINWFAYFLLSAWLIASIWLCIRAKKTPEKTNPFILQFIPSLFTTLGILGTFLGIGVSLYLFNPNEIEKSIPEFLEGMKTAFFTSILGVIGSIIFSFWTKYLLKVIGAKIPVPESDETKQLKTLVSVTQENKSMLLALTQELQQTRSAFVNTNESSSQSLLDEIRKTNEQLLSSAQGSEKHAAKMVDTLNKNHRLMEQKFTEFAELMASANTDALREAMESLISDFNDTFRSLITNLVNQNFEELNESVKNLNSWQQQYKNLIQELIGKVDKTVRELDATAQRVQKTQEIAHDKLQAIEDTLSGISSYTEDLVADEGKLAKILEGLTEVLVDENELTRAFDHAVDAMERLRNSSEDFEATKKQITNWLNREQGINGAMTLFNAGVADLTQRLQALQGIKMEDMKLLDNSFNQRLQGALNTSFAHLDALIKEYIGFLEKSRKIEITVNDKSNGKI